LANQSPSAAIVLVNAMWLMSLVLSVTSALFATLLQQWARRYIEMPQVPGLANERARVRSYLFLGTLEYDMFLAVETVPTLLHFSVFLFFSGLVIFFFTIHKTVAIAVSVAVGAFAVIYFTLTILPYFDHKCPYRTPISDLAWYPWKACLSLTTVCLYWVVGWVHSCLIPDNLGQGEDMTQIQVKLVNWLEIWEGAYRKHWSRLKNGFEGSIIQGALDAPVDVDRDALTRLFSLFALADRSEFLTFMANIPRDEIVRIMTPPFESGKIIFREPLLALIESCAVDPNAHRLDENKRKKCLTVWLAAVLHITKAFFVPNQVPETELGNLLDDVLINFADSRRMKAMCADADTAIRFTSRTICALLAKWLLQNGRLYVEELRWLETVTGVPRDEIPNFLDTHRILEFLVFGIFPHQEGDIPDQAGDVLTAHASSFVESLAILTDAGTQPPFDRLTFIERISDLVHLMEASDPHAIFIAAELHQNFPEFILAPSQGPPIQPAP